MSVITSCWLVGPASMGTRLLKCSLLLVYFSGPREALGRVPSRDL